MHAWDQFLQKRERELGSQTAQKWLKTLKVLRFDACNLYLEAKDNFQLLWFEEHVRSIAEAEFKNGNHKKITIHLSLKGSVAEAPKKQRKKSVSSDYDSTTPFNLVFDELNPQAQPESFIFTDNNLLISKIIHEMTDFKSGRKIDNPIYIYGPTGCGKTHLLMSLAHTYRKHGLNTIYVRAETFTNHVVKAIRAGQMNIFRQAYRHADVLIIDDIHVFSGRGATQEEFFHTFNALHLDGKQIILAANCSPGELLSIEPRLISRFEWGIALPLKPLLENELENLLKMKMNLFHFHLPEKIVEYLLSEFSRNPKILTRALEALVLRLHVENEFSLSKLGLSAVKLLLDDLRIEEEKAATTPEKIILSTSNHFHLKKEDILGKAQTKECALPRQIAMYLCREKLKLPYAKIGEIFSRDHSTVMASVKYIKKSLEEGSHEILHACYQVIKLIDA